MSQKARADRKSRDSRGPDELFPEDELFRADLKRLQERWDGLPQRPAALVKRHPRITQAQFSPDHENPLELGDGRPVGGNPAI